MSNPKGRSSSTIGSSFSASTPTRIAADNSDARDNGRCTRHIVDIGVCPSDRADAVISSDTCAVPASTAPRPGARNRTTYA
ncbi:MAG: hypothetical protein R2697_17160 [Ilumatobacteraceae bacterium]